MEHSMFVSLVLILMLFGLAVLIILIVVLKKIREELRGIKEKLFIINPNREREKQRLFFKAKLHGEIKEKYMDKGDEKANEKKGGGNFVQAATVPGGTPPTDPGPKSIDFDVAGEISTSLEE